MEFVCRADHRRLLGVQSRDRRLMQNLAIIGCGRVASARYVEVCRDELRDARVIVACDRVPSRADELARALACDSEHDYDDVLRRNDVDVVMILTESGHHYRHACSALQAGKHVIVEKPPGMLPSQVLDCVELAAKRERMYAPILQNRLNPAMLALKEACDEGRFGRQVLATIRLRWCRFQEYYEDGWHGTWQMDGGVINQQAFHHIDALQWIAGPVAEVVSAQTNALNQLQAEDTTVAALRFEDGSLGTIEATTAIRPEDVEASISIAGEGGMAVIGGIALNEIQTWHFVEPRPEDETTPERASQVVPTGYGLSHGPLIQEVIDRLERGELDPPISGQDALPAVRLVHALYKSEEVGGWVRLADDPLSERVGHATDDAT